MKARGPEGSLPILHSSASTRANDLLVVQDLFVTYRRRGQVAYALQGARLAVAPGESVGLVGESGSGKSTLVRAVMGLLPEGQASVDSGKIVISGTDVTAFTDRDWIPLRGSPIAVVFQDSLNLLNPIQRIERQLAEAVELHGSSEHVGDRARELIDLVRLPQRTLRSYPFELSGGMRQRVNIAIALACRPRLLVADEPTTALDVTTQAEILQLLDRLRASQGLSLLLVSHDLALVRQRTDRVYVMYAGRMVETGPTSKVLRTPGHPYVRGLLAAAQTMRDYSSGRFATIDGDVPDLKSLSIGCPFAPRCPAVMPKCTDNDPPEFYPEHTPDHSSRCWLHENNGNQHVLGELGSLDRSR